MIDKKVVLLTNEIPSYRKSLFKLLNESITNFTIVLSNNKNKENLLSLPEKLKIKFLKTIKINRKIKHPHNFTEVISIHIPFNTISVLKKLKPDVIISAEMGIRSLLALIYCKLHKNTKLIIWATLSEYSELSRGGFRVLLRKLLLKNCDKIIVNGKSGKRYIEKLGCQKQKINIIPYSTNMEPFLNININDKNQYCRKILVVAQLIERKGITEFMRVIQKWLLKNREINIELTIIGAGYLMQELKESDYPENLKLTLPGLIDYSDLPEYFKKNDIFIFPTLVDEWGVVVNEALASGLPVTGSIYSQAIEELIIDGKNGYKFDPINPGNFYEILDKILFTDTALLKTMSINARDSIKFLTPEFVKDKILSLIE